MIFIVLMALYEIDIGSGLRILGLLGMANFVRVYSRVRDIEGTWQQGRVLFLKFRVRMMSRIVLRTCDIRGLEMR